MPGTRTNLEELHILEPSQVKFHMAETSHLSLDINGKSYSDVAVKRCFPLSAPTQYLALLDKEGKELGLLEESDQLDQDSLDALAHYFEIAYFVAHIVRILKVEATRGITTWTVETNKGSRTIVVRDRSDVRFLPDHAILLTDVDGMRYLVPDSTKLDAASAGLLEEYT